MLGHDHVSVDYETVLTAGFFQDCQKQVATAGRAEFWLPMVTTAGDEVEVVRAVVALGVLRHAVRIVSRSEFYCDPDTVEL